MMPTIEILSLDSKLSELHLENMLLTKLRMVFPIINWN